MIKPIYKPSGRAAEYGELALNIYTGCNHGCTYCYAPLVLKKDRATFHNTVEPRKDVVEAVRRQLERESITGKTIHLCFSCDPYPASIDTLPTREIIMLLKQCGNHVQILTKGGERAERDFDLLDGEDRFGVTYATKEWFKAHEYEPNAAPNLERLASLERAKKQGIGTWVSCEPVFEPELVYGLIKVADYIDHFKIGKLNYVSSDIDWGKFGLECERLCRIHKRDHYIKEDLRKLYSL